VLVTGSSGLIGSFLVQSLSPAHLVQGLDAAPGPHTSSVVDMRSPDAVTEAFGGIDTVVHLAANSDAGASWEEVLHNNLPVTVNALEAARRTSVRRVVLASSNHVVGLAERDEPYASILAGRHRGLTPQTLERITVEDPVRPDGPYGAEKAFAEAAARLYAEEYGVSALCLRIGTVNREDRPTTTRHRSTLLSRRDLLDLVQCCLRAPADLRFGVYFGVSGNSWRIWDLENARRELGYVPEDDAEQWP